MFFFVLMKNKKVLFFSEAVFFFKSYRKKFIHFFLFVKFLKRDSLEIDGF